MGKKKENTGIRGKVRENGRREQIKWGQMSVTGGKRE
jgi:hypothetical protein